MFLIRKDEQAKLDKLMAIEGFDTVHDLIEVSMWEGSKGICMSPGCSYTTDVEGDQHEGWCESCGTNTVKSAMLLVGMV